MKKIKLLFGLLFVAGTILAQSGQAPLSKGDKQLNLGLGFSSHGLPVYAGVDFAVHNDWTVGPAAKIIIDDNFKFGVLGRFDYHWNRLIGIPSDWDFYAGANLGFNIGDDLNLDLGIQVGGRWYWSETLSLFPWSEG